MSTAVEQWLAKPDSIEQLRLHAPDNFSVDRAKRSVLALLQTDASQGGRLSECTPRSLVLTIVQASALGLELGTADAYVIPYRNKKTGELEATLSIGFQGMIKLAKRSGEVDTLKAEVVYEGEPFVVHSSSDNTRFGYDHSISFPRSKKPIIAVYVRIVRHDGSIDYEVMDADEIEQVKKASRAKMGGKLSPAWSEWEGEMAKKAVIRRALKRYNLTPEIEQIFVREDAAMFADARSSGTALQASSLNRRLSIVPDPQQLEDQRTPMTSEPAPSRQAQEEPASESAPPAVAQASLAGVPEADPAALRASIAQLVSRSDAPDEFKELAKGAYNALPVDQLLQMQRELKDASVDAADPGAISERGEVVMNWSDLAPKEGEE